MRRQFFERVPVNAAIVSAYASRCSDEQTITVELARQDAPLGRPLRNDECVRLRWTLHAPDDDAIPDKAMRRRHRLLRVLDEAAAAGACPTDDQLAIALGVSRRTILRDIETLVTSGSVVTTRRRSRAGSVTVANEARRSTRSNSHPDRGI
jgi:hypothetical protein